MNPEDHPHGGGEGKAPIGRKNPTTMNMNVLAPSTLPSRFFFAVIMTRAQCTSSKVLRLSN
jgi:hypothetical protein